MYLNDYDIAQLFDSDLPVPPRSAHREECDKQWRSFLGTPIPASSCPTCRALEELDGPTVFDAEDFPIVELLYSGRGWSVNVLGDTDE